MQNERLAKIIANPPLLYIDGRERCRESNSKFIEKRRWGRRRVEKGRMKGWRKSNSKMWNNEEKKSQKWRGRVGGRVTIR